MKRLDSCKLFAGADTAETLAGILGIEQTSVCVQKKGLTAKLLCS